MREERARATDLGTRWQVGREPSEPASCGLRLPPRVAAVLPAADFCDADSVDRLRPPVEPRRLPERRLLLLRCAPVVGQQDNPSVSFSLASASQKMPFSSSN